MVEIYDTAVTAKYLWDYIHQARYKIKPIIDVKKVTSAHKGNERCTIQA